MKDARRGDGTGMDAAQDEGNADGEDASIAERQSTGEASSTFVTSTSG